MLPVSGLNPISSRLEQLTLLVVEHAKKTPEVAQQLFEEIFPVKLGQKLTIGRHHALKDLFNNLVSRKHLILQRYNDGRVWLTDTSSIGTRIKRCGGEFPVHNTLVPLMPNDEI